MSRSQSESEAGRELIGRLKTARDTARVHVHLLSLDARQRFGEIDANLAQLESQLARGADKISETVAQKAKDLGQAIAELLRDADGSLELATPVSVIVNASPATCAPADSLNRAAQIMWEQDCGAVPVVDQDGRLMGILTDRDICMASYTRGQPLWSISVVSTMSRATIRASASDSIGTVLRLMSEGRVRRIPILENERLVGIVSLADIARHIRRNAWYSVPACLALAHALSDISEAPASMRGAAE